MKTNRIEYIDALRGFAILLVIFCHIEIHSFQNQAFLYTHIYKLIHMPLFFFISGYIALQNNKVWDTHTFLQESMKKTRILIVPAFLFGLIYTYFFANGNLAIFISDISKQGYWFTIALFEMFLVYYTANYILYRCKQKVSNHTFIAAMFMTILGVYLLKISSLYYKPINDFMNITSFYYLPFYYPHFIFGVIAAKYKTYFEKFIDNSYVMAGILIVFSTILGFRPYLIEHLLGGKEISACIISFTGIIVVYNFFRKYQTNLSSSTKLGASLQYIGKKTLDIYLLHYFFLPYIPKIHQLWGTSPNLIMELIGFLLVFLVIGCCLITSNIIRLSDFLGYWLFGTKYSKVKNKSEECK